MLFLSQNGRYFLNTIKLIVVFLIHLSGRKNYFHTFLGNSHFNVFFFEWRIKCNPTLQREKREESDNLRERGRLDQHLVRVRPESHHAQLQQEGWWPRCGWSASQRVWERWRRGVSRRFLLLLLLAVFHVLELQFRQF